MGQFLTRRQKAILDFISDFHQREGVMPTHREICEQFGYSSYGTVHKHLRLLREKGYLRRHWNQKRGLELVADPANAATGSSASGGSGGELTEGAQALVDLPFLGQIAAGRPIEALPGDEVLPVPRHLMGRNGHRHYVLKVQGQSMIEEGIHDGDYVIVQQQEHADSGEMVVALIDGEATLKRFYPEGPRVRLQPANANMEPIWVPADRLRLQGVVIGLMRRY